MSLGNVYLKTSALAKQSQIQKKKTPAVHAYLLGCSSLFQMLNKNLRQLKRSLKKSPLFGSSEPPYELSSAFQLRLQDNAKSFAELQWTKMSMPSLTQKQYQYQKFAYSINKPYQFRKSTGSKH